jgi:hypothetical protein
LRLSLASECVTATMANYLIAERLARHTVEFAGLLHDNCGVLQKTTGLTPDSLRVSRFRNSGVTCAMSR